jgi:hypothetical protein
MIDMLKSGGEFSSKQVKASRFKTTVIILNVPGDRGRDALMTLWKRSI